MWGRALPDSFPGQGHFMFIPNIDFVSKMGHRGLHIETAVIRECRGDQDA